MSEFTDKQLIARVNEIHRQLDVMELQRQNKRVTKEILRIKKGDELVSLVETTVRGKKVHIITTTDAAHYRVLSQNRSTLLKAHEVLGSRNTIAYGPLATEADKAAAKAKGKRFRPKRQKIHAEQLGVNDAVRMGGTRGRAATSNLGCDRQCVSLLRREFPHFRHVNPKVPGTQPPPIPTDAPPPRAPSASFRGTPSTAPSPGQGGKSAVRATGLSARGLAPEPAKIARTPAIRRLGSGFGRGGLAAARQGSRALMVGAMTGGRVILQAGRFLVQAVKAVGVTTIAFMIIEVILAWEQMKKDRALRKAIESHLQKNLPGALQKLVRAHERAIVGHFLSQWGKPGRMFIYWSPLIEVIEKEGGGRGRYDFAVTFEKEGGLFNYAISHKPLKPDFRDFRGVTRLYFQLRFTLTRPVLTPFDGVSLYAWVLGQVVRANWEQYRDKLKPADIDAFAKVALLLSKVMAEASKDFNAGFEGIGGQFNYLKAVNDRKRIVKAIHRIRVQLKKPVEHLLARRLLERDQSLLVFDSLKAQAVSMDGVADPFDLAIGRLNALNVLGDSVLEYQRSESLDVHGSLHDVAVLNDSFDEITQGVRDQVPSWVYKHGIIERSLNLLLPSGPIEVSGP